MAFRVAALCKTEGIPPKLVYNSEQTAVHLRPSTEQTYEVKGVKEVKCLGKDDKRQITAVVEFKLPVMCKLMSFHLQLRLLRL